MKLKLQFIIVAFIALAIYAPVAHGQAILTFSGGSGTRLSTTLQRAVTYTIINSDCNNTDGFYFVFQAVGNPFGAGFEPFVTGTTTYSINGGAAQPISSQGSGLNFNDLRQNDFYESGRTGSATSGATVVLSAGTLTTNGDITAAPPANGSYVTFIASMGSGFRCSSNGVAAATTAATVSVGGRVTTQSGSGITNVRLSLTDSIGQVKIATTIEDGSYRFDDVEVGASYIIAATGKRFTFSRPSQLLNINEETSEVNFIANSERRVRIF